MKTCPTESRFSPRCAWLGSIALCLALATAQGADLNKGSDLARPRITAVGADSNWPALDGLRPIHLAGNSATVINMLVQAGADVHAKDEAERTPLHRASDEEAVRAPLATGAAPDVAAANGDTPLHIAARAKDEEAVRALLAAGAAPDVAAANGDTPLHIAARARARYIMWRLLMAGADAAVENAAGASPYALALQHQDDALLLVFKDAGFTPPRMDRVLDELTIRDVLTGAVVPRDALLRHQVYGVKVDYAAGPDDQPMPLQKGDVIVAVNDLRVYDRAEYALVRYATGEDPARLLVRRGTGVFITLEMPRCNAETEPIRTFGAGEWGSHSRRAQLGREPGSSVRGVLRTDTLPRRLLPHIDPWVGARVDSTRIRWAHDLVRLYHHVTAPNGAELTIADVPRDPPSAFYEALYGFYLAVRKHRADPAAILSPAAHGVSPAFFALYYPCPILSDAQIKAGQPAFADEAFAAALLDKVRGTPDEAVLADVIAACTARLRAAETRTLRMLHVSQMLALQQKVKPKSWYGVQQALRDSAFREEVFAGLEQRLRAEPADRTMTLFALTVAAYLAADYDRAGQSMETLARETPAYAVAAHRVWIPDGVIPGIHHRLVPVEGRMAVARAMLADHPIYMAALRLQPGLLRFLSRDEDAPKWRRPCAVGAGEFTMRLSEALYRHPQVLLNVTAAAEGREPNLAGPPPWPMPDPAGSDATMP